MKQLSAIVLFLTMLGTTFSRYMVVLDYQLNKAYIAKNLCVNRDKPQMKCEGKCYLCKKLNTEDKKDQENPERKTDKGNQLIYSEMNGDIAVAAFVASLPDHALSASDNKTFDQPSFCFHPPD